MNNDLKKLVLLTLMDAPLDLEISQNQWEMKDNLIIEAFHG